EKVFSNLGRIRKIKEKNLKKGKQTIIIVAGCVAQARGEYIFKRAPYVDIVVGSQSYHRLPELLKRYDKNVVDIEIPEIKKFDSLPESSSSKTSVFLTIQEGCNNYCSYCVVPYTRGAEYSRSVVSIRKEAEHYVKNGACEITLLGQNVDSWHGEALDGKPWKLGQLIRNIVEIQGLERIRYMTSHPRDMDDDLIAAHKDVPQLMPYVHLPIQSGSDRILKLMNRQYTVSEYLKAIDKLRKARPDIAFSTDIIVGFPDETDEDFAQTLKIVEKMEYSQAYSFKYSPRPNTVAEKMGNHVSEDVKIERLAILQERLKHHQKNFNRKTVGKTLPVLFEHKGRHGGQLIGRTPYMQAVYANVSREMLGKVVELEIIDSSLNSLSGKILA
ncbi:MAG: tRNA (N6-isopentenyl adenosine(37)-C2)-methylthiotransferase MiaB, partial [Alphaproteobacteria bacterium]|nr:tRNA (N6-isopentenyl adenosine(37)-C2)-methylthiotransferase MiaB [Alphaproteobacteria bacterium]